MSKILNSIIVAFVCICTCAFAEQYNPSPNPQSVVLADNVRFTVLNPRVIRMEWSEKNQFEDHSTLVFVNRFLPAPDYSKSVEDGWMTIQTESLRLRYKLGSGRFTADNLNVDMNCNGMEKSWKFGQENPGNLKGTIRTLDGTDGGYSFYRKQDIELEPGLISRDGWVVIDDTARPIFDNTDWSWVMARPEGEHQDLYFFAYGYDYKAVLSDYTKIAGKIALPPKFAFGYWYSRWRSFSDMEFQELVDTFEKFKIPLDVLVVDMD